MDEPIKIDGNYLEGGGQIVRTALCLSTLLNKPFEAADIRKGRKQPGLKAQHLSAINALAGLCNAKTNEVKIGSDSLSFTPGELAPRTMSIDIGTAGSITLLLQSLWLPLILHGGKFRIKIKGGTDTAWSMPIDYLSEVFVPQIRRYADIELKLTRRGYYPAGGGEIELKVKGKYALTNIANAPKIDLVERGTLYAIRGISHASAELSDAQVAERQARAAKHLLAGFDVPVTIDTRYYETQSTGSGITLWAIFSRRADEIDVENPIRIGADALGERGRRAEFVGEEAAKKLLSGINSGAAVDSHLADNLVPIIALFGGRMRASELSSHTLTNAYTVQQFLGDVLDVDAENKTVKRK
jgi:RNA 3'-phosphate cyclase